MAQKYIILLRGINVGGHKKVPMATLRQVLADMGYSNIKTLLNSGNAIIEGPDADVVNIEAGIAERLAKEFGFDIPVLVRTQQDFDAIDTLDPFKDTDVHKDTRLYATFIKGQPLKRLELPWVSDDQTFQIITEQANVVFSVLDVSKTKTVEAMAVLEKVYGKDITTRNWNTVLRILKALQS